MSVESFPFINNKLLIVYLVEKIIRLFELKDHTIFSTEPGAFCGV